MVPTAEIESSATEDSITLTWPAVSGVDGYEVGYSLEGENPVTYMTEVTETTVTFNDMEPGEDYWLWVKPYKTDKDGVRVYQEEQAESFPVHTEGTSRNQSSTDTTETEEATESTTDEPAEPAEGESAETAPEGETTEETA